MAAPARPHGKLRQCRAQACKKTAPIDIGAAGFPRLKLSSAVWRAAGTAWRQAGLLTGGSAAGARSSRFPSDGLSSLCAASPYTAAVPFRILTCCTILLCRPPGGAGTCAMYSLFLLIVYHPAAHLSRGQRNSRKKLAMGRGIVYDRGKNEGSPPHDRRTTPEPDQRPAP